MNKPSFVKVSQEILIRRGPFHTKGGSEIAFPSNLSPARKRRHETRYYEVHLASELDRSCWIRIPLEEICCLYECRPVRRSSVFEHICTVLEKTGPTHVIGSKLFTSGRECIRRHFCLSLSDPLPYPPQFERRVLFRGRLPRLILSTIDTS